MKNKPVIFMDMDGVIADIAAGYKQMFGRDILKDDTFTVFQHIRTNQYFFRKLPVHEKGLELFNHLKNDYDIKFLTTPVRNMSNCKLDKIEWVRENLGDYDVYFSENKAEFVIDNQSILIDDMEKNLIPWKEEGGTAIRFPQSIDKILAKIDETFNPTEEVERIKSKLKNMVVNLNPTEKQKESGNYKKSDVINIKGLKIRIENPKGSIRWGFDSPGQKWVSKMHCHYGYIIGTEGADYDPVDVFLGPELNRSLAFVVNQNKGDGMFDEHKIMLGYPDIESAKGAYLKNYQKGWESRIDSLIQTNTKKIRDWLESGNKSDPFKLD